MKNCVVCLSSTRLDKMISITFIIRMNFIADLYCHNITCRKIVSLLIQKPETSSHKGSAGRKGETNKGTGITV